MDLLNGLSEKKYCVTCASGTDALIISLLAAGVRPNDEVLVTNFSWISTASAISTIGAVPVFCDINDKYFIDIDSIKRMYSPKCKAVIATPLYGDVFDLSDIKQFCLDHNMFLLEDSAQAIGNRLNGDISIISFNTNKTVNGPSGGGAMLTDDEELASKCTLLRRHGKRDDDFVMLGLNSIMPKDSELEIINQLDRFNDIIQQKQDAADLYDDYFQEKYSTYNNHKYVIRVEERDFAKKAIPGSQIHYPRPLSEYSLYKSLPHRKDNCVESQKACDTVLTLPLNNVEETLKILPICM